MRSALILLAAVSSFAWGLWTESAAEPRPDAPSAPPLAGDEDQGGGAEPAPNPAPAPEANAKDENNPAFHARLKEIAGSYARWGRVDAPQWAPTDCKMPGASTARMSASKDSESHGKKLYFLFGSSIRDYVKATAEGAAEAPAGLAIVKESWVPREVPAGTIRVRRQEPRDKREGDYEDPRGAFPPSDFVEPYAEKDGKLYTTGAKHGLFVMYKLDPKTPGTDEGWVYGAVSADGKTVTGAGKLTSCMECHTQAEHGRLFGLK
ncbi:MAG: cytochrome P460 family protein [Planctomycetota bacterium]|nr:cytochrome P460 family protein [Planctomycetota bacterium]